MWESVKLADNQQVVEKIELNQEEFDFMKNYEHLEFYRQEDNCFHQKLGMYTLTCPGGVEAKFEIRNRLTRAYFYGYTVRETKYYIKFPSWQGHEGKTYLNVDNDDGEWLLTTKIPLGSIQSQFTQKEIDAMQKDERAKGLNLNEAKVRVPDEELVD